MNDPIDPTIVEKAAKTIWRWYVGSNLDGFDKHAYAYDAEKATAAAREALEAVADDLRAEGAATALDLVRADIRAAALIRDYDPTRSMWTNLEVFEQAGIYTTEWFNDLLAYDSEEEQS